MKDLSDNYLLKETSSVKKPIELYHIWQEDGAVDWYYTSGDRPITYNGQIYTPAVLQRSSVRYDSQLEVTTCNIQASYLDESVLEFIAFNPINVVWVSIMRVHRDQDPIEASVVFLGQIKSVAFKGVVAQIQCVGFEKYLSKPIPVNRYQLTCNHKVFDENCGLDSEDYKVEAVVTLDSTETILTSSTFGEYENGYFTYGKVVFNGDRRTIVHHDGSDITIAFRMSSLKSGDTVMVYPGCDGRAETCRDKFDNIANFLGFPFIPQENPAARVP